MRFLIIGATGACGKQVVEKALGSGHEVTVYVRTLSKLPQELATKVKVLLHLDPAASTDPRL